MTTTFRLTADRRGDTGRGANRRLRLRGGVPAVIYGAGKEPLDIELNARELMHQLENEAFYSHILTLTVAGTEERVVLKAMQRHPSQPRLLHLDFLRVDENKAITVRVPLHLVNEDSCVGVKQEGGIISRIITELEVSCLPSRLPEYIEIDIAGLHLGETLHLGDLETPAGVTIYALAHGGDPAQPVVSVHAPRVVVEEEDTAAEQEAAESEAEAGGAEAKQQAD